MLQGSREEGRGRASTGCGCHSPFQGQTKLCLKPSKQIAAQVSLTRARHMVTLAAREAGEMKASLVQDLDQEQNSSQGSPLLALRASAHSLFFLPQLYCNFFSSLTTEVYLQRQGLTANPCPCSQKLPPPTPCQRVSVGIIQFLFSFLLFFFFFFFNFPQTLQNSAFWSCHHQGDSCL